MKWLALTNALAYNAAILISAIKSFLANASCRALTKYLTNPISEADFTLSYGILVKQKKFIMHQLNVEMNLYKQKSLFDRIPSLSNDPTLNIIISGNLYEASTNHVANIR